MAGLYGTVGTKDEFKKVQKHFFFTGEEYLAKYADKKRSIHAIFHRKNEAKSQPFEQDEVNIIIWGEICGYGDLRDYSPRKEIEHDHSDAEYCAILYKRYGIDFIKRLNSNFAGIIFDNSESKTHLFTDRLGSRPIYYTKGEKNSLIFSTSLQAVACHSDYDLRIDHASLCQYLTINNVLGTRTPLKNIREVHPGSILTFDQKTGKVKREVYWKPNYSPLDKNFKFFIDWFSEIFDDVMKDNIYVGKDYGLLLSGGVDSRIIADYLKKQKMFHMNKAMNREAKIAKSVADITGNDFEFLEMDLEFLPRILEEASPLMNLNSPFQAARLFGFLDPLKNADVLISGKYSDNILQGMYIPRLRLKLPLPQCTEIELFRYIYPKKIGSLSEYLDSLDVNNPEYLDKDFKLKNKLIKEDGKIEINGVCYDKIENLIHYGFSYPLTNSKAFLSLVTLNQINETFLPYTDNRIVEFSQYIPTKYKIRRDIVKRILRQKNTELSKLLYPHSLQPTDKHELIHVTFKFLHLALDKIKNHMSGELSSPNYVKVIKDTGYAEKVIEENKYIFDIFDYLDYEEALEMVSNTDGGVYHKKIQIHSLVSFLKIYDKILNYRSEVKEGYKP